MKKALSLTAMFLAAAIWLFSACSQQSPTSGVEMPGEQYYASGGCTVTLADSGSTAEFSIIGPGFFPFCTAVSTVGDTVTLTAYLQDLPPGAEAERFSVNLAASLSCKSVSFLPKTYVFTASDSSSFTVSNNTAVNIQPFNEHQTTYTVQVYEDSTLLATDQVVYRFVVDEDSDCPE